MQRLMSKNRVWMKAAASTMMLAAVTMVGCSGGGLNRPGLASRPTDAGKIALDAERALAKRQGAKAVAAAEAAVAAQPENAGYRTLLGRAYLLDGRYVSAETSFSDAMTLGARDSRTIVSLALAQIASGKSSEARAMLADNRDVLPSADYGLAAALAGDAEQGVSALEAAMRQPGASAKTRQNLAYAYALAGRWAEAKLAASQDLAPDQAQARILQWAAAAQPGAEAQRVAALTGVTPRADDAGLPVRLALGSTAGATIRTAEAQSAPAPAMESNVETPQAPTAIASFAEPTATVGAGASDSVRIVETAAVQPSVTAKPAFVPAAAKPASPVRQVAYTPVVKGSGNYVVQLGAYSSAAVARAGFNAIARRNEDVAAHNAIHTRATVHGRQFYRVAIGGFDRGSADSLCASIRAKGGACFVRGTAATPAQGWAKATPKAAKAHAQQFASR